MKTRQRPSLSFWIAARVFCCLILLLTSANCLVAQSNSIFVENALAGNPPANGTSMALGIQASKGSQRTSASIEGETIRFKVKTNATNYGLDIYRLGYYGGFGARKVATVTPSAALPQTQPNPIVDSQPVWLTAAIGLSRPLGLVPATATSGVYIAKLVRTDTGGASHIIFVVRDDSSDIRSSFPNLGYHMAGI